MENGNCSSVAPAPKYKRRKVFAVRDFPPGCGRHAQPLNLRPTEETETPVTTNTHENSDCKQGSGDGQNNGTSGLLEDLHEVVAATLKEEIIPVLLDHSFLLPSNGPVAVPKENGLEKRVARNYPRRRRVSAIRDFPPNCGRNAPRPSKEESPKELASLENQSCDLEKFESGINDKTPTETVKIDVQKTVEDVQDDDLGKRSEAGASRVTRNAVQPRESESRMNDKTPAVTVKIDVKQTVKDVQDGDLCKSKLGKSVSEVTGETVQRNESVELLASMGNKTLVREKFRSEVDEKLSKETVTAGKQTVGNAQPNESQAVLVSSKNKSFGQAKSRPAMDAKTSTETANADLKQTVDSTLDGDSYKSKLERHGSKVDRTEVHHKCEKIGVEEESEMKMEQEERENHNEPPFEDKLYWWDHEFETVVGKGDDDVEGSEEHSGKEVVACSEEKTVNEKNSDTSRYDNLLRAVDLGSSELPSDRVVVQGLMAASCCPWRHGKVARKSKPAAGTSGKKTKNMSGSKGKKLDTMSPVEGQKTKMTVRKKVDGNEKFSPEAASQGTVQLVVWDKDNSLQHNKPEDLQEASASYCANVNVPPLCPSISSIKHQDNDAVVTRHKVRETLRLYQAVYRKLLQEEEAKLKEGKQARRRIDLHAAHILKEKQKLVNVGKQILGPVPGVEVGDEFQYRIELNVIGLHRQTQGGIDYVKHGGKILATSVVASGGYADDLDNSDVLIYMGQGGNVMNADKEPEDQKLERGNLALKNSMDEKNPVRVIRGCEAAEGKAKTYVYDGLYMVQKFWQDVGPHGKQVFQYQLERIPGQPELAWKEVKKSKKYKVREGVCVDDISQGKEVIPICAINTIDDEKPPPFKYITSLIYPDWYHPTPPGGCNCATRCSDSVKCSCAVKNGGEIPYNHNGAIVEVKPLVYECGPSCRCSSSCHNRVSQHGIKFQLEIFKTQKMGWGVRSLNFIPSGSFICEYVGELLKEKEAEERAGNDEYLFDIGNNYNDNTLWDGLLALIPELQHASPDVVEDGCFTIDAAEYGNVGRFINHSCTPNLYAQNVLYDHDDKRIPHIMLFAAENIPPLQELTYHYNYTIDQVRDSNGDIKKKSCFCGSPECTGRLY